MNFRHKLYTTFRKFYKKKSTHLCTSIQKLYKQENVTKPLHNNALQHYAQLYTTTQKDTTLYTTLQKYTKLYTALQHFYTT